MRASLAILLLAFAAPRVDAADGLFLTWGDCAFNGAGQSVRSSACNDDLATHKLYCGLALGQSVDSVLALEITVDVQIAASSLPDWWRYDAGGCRDGKLTADLDFLGLSACRVLWPPGASRGLEYFVGLPHGSSNQARIRVGVAVPSNQSVALDANDMYYAARIVLAGTGSTGACPGCAESACLVLNSVRVIRPPRPEGTPSSDVLVTSPGPGNANWAAWQTASAATCQAVPVRNRTWGAVKSLYR